LGSQVSVDGTLRGTASPGRPLNLLNTGRGQVRIQVSAAGYEAASQRATLEAGEWTQVVVELVPVVPPAPRPVTPHPAPRPSPSASTGRRLRASMAHIAAGEFTMGSTVGDSDEEPEHRVYVSGFYMDQYEVTNAQWNDYARSQGASTKDFDAAHPVVSVNWEDARAYCSWADKRLPTESEWEKAARGGLSGMKYPWGDEITHDSANYSGTGSRDRWANTAPVGSFEPNGYGLYDMAGNVWEWVSDWYDEGYYASSPSRNPQGPSGGTRRVLRGGGWSRSAPYLRAAYRSSVIPSCTSISSLGFRCAQDE
jgi:formylglycine-generating enzyme required for sulfatase activity